MRLQCCLYLDSRYQIELYMETLQHLQSIIDCYAGQPILIVGYMNASLPQHESLSVNWYKNHPFNAHSLMLYDFLCDNDMVVTNFLRKQVVNYTYSKGSHTSYIDHVFAPKHMTGVIKNCQIVN